MITGYRRYRRSKHPPFVPFQNLVSIVLVEPANLTKTMWWQGAQGPQREGAKTPSNPTYEETKVNAVYKPSKSKEPQMQSIATDTRDDWEDLEQDRRWEFDKAYGYVEFKYKFIKLLSDFEWMSDSHRGRVYTAKYVIELASAGAKPIHSAPFLMGSKVCQCIKRISAKEGWFLTFPRQVSHTNWC